MKEKILAKLKEKFSGLPLEYLGFVADKLAKKTTDESKIDESITTFDDNVGIEEQAGFFQKESDRRVSDAKKAFEKSSPPPGDPKPGDPKPDDIGMRLEALSKKVADYEVKEKQQGLRSSLLAKMKEKKIPEVFAKGIHLSTDEDVDKELTDIEASYKLIEQTILNKGLKETPAPFSSVGTVDQVAADIKSWALDNKPKAEMKQSN